MNILTAYGQQKMDKGNIDTYFEEVVINAVFCCNRSTFYQGRYKCFCQ